MRLAWGFANWARTALEVTRAAVPPFEDRVPFVRVELLVRELGLPLLAAITGRDFSV